jgi:hypothetical protein
LSNTVAKIRLLAFKKEINDESDVGYSTGDVG